MKNILLLLLSVSSVVFINGCGLKEQKRIEMTQVQQMQDSIPKIIPGVRSIHIIQDDDYSKVMIIVGTPSFFDANDDRKQQSAINTGAMVLHVLGADNSLSKGTLVITKKDMDTKEVPADGISIDMKIDSLKKVIYPGK
jgi:hypothetical protein